MSCKDTMLLMGQVTDATWGVKYLESMLLTVLGVPYSADSLVSTLFHISMLLGIKGSHANMNTIQVVASILSEIELEDKSGLIIDVVAEKLIEQLDSVRQEVVTIMQGLKDSVAEVATAAKT